MRWKKKLRKVKVPASEPKYGDKKVVLRFALLPTRIDNKYVWMESYYSNYQYASVQRPYSPGDYDRKYYRDEWVHIDREFKN